MKTPAILIFFLFPFQVLAWSGYTHSLIAKESLIDVAEVWGLNQPVARTSFEQFLEKFSQRHPAIQTKEGFARWLKINPASRFDQPSRAEKAKTQLTPLEILSLYAPRADDGRDQKLPYDKAEQFWFGSGTKTGSQAFRHMEKPPFNPLHPLNTFGFPLGSIGQATQRAQIYFDLAIEAYQLGEAYWAWNFLGVGLHYIEDLSQPYHTVQLLAPFALKGFQAYFAWGLRKDRGWIETITHVVSNAHHYFEGYVDYFLWKENNYGKHWKKGLRGRQTLPDITSMEALAKQLRNHANQSAFAAVQATFHLTGKSLLTHKLYDVWDEESEHPEDPLSYLTADQTNRIEGAGQISKIMLEVLASQGKAVRTMVGAFLERVSSQED